ncbi:tetratricopeptide repeat-containing sulfotransferase family protein [Maricaulis salignorans]|uniref:Flp pilus assembly protein TadD, contains TPR repeats n=1 Tax=Maricaulis salignorans TaxID=144026 RepID=A0A1G9MMZ4_9PROT|nr:tetratricopeptide repeat-containing sulfotransferase family protein [Maricaulis salignorans]SDL75620.1 Flp pilus assembly protein TadD, contains TPR repeats [Maricaulis salignorans]
MTETIEDFIREGNAQLGAGAHGSACLAFCRALDLEPRLAAAHYNLGAILLMSGRAAESLPCLMTAAMLKPSSTQLTIALARALLESGYADRAAATLDRASRDAPDDAMLRELTGQYPLSPAAAASLDGFANRVSPAQGDASFQRALAAFDAGRDEEAFALASELIWVAPRSLPVWKLLSSAAETCASGEYAEMCARRALAIEPQDARAWTNLARIVRGADGRQGDAERILRRGLEVCGPGETLAVALCDLLFGANEPERGVAVLDEVEAALSAPSARLKRLRAAALENAGVFDEAEAHYRAALALAPTNPEIISAAAAFFDRQVDIAPLQALIEKAHADGIDFNADELRHAEARLMLRTDRPEDARASVLRAMELPAAPDQVRSRYYTLGRIEDKLGNYPAAFDAFQAGNALRETVWETHGPCDHTVTTRRIESLQRRLAAEIESGRSAIEDREAGPGNIAFLVGFPRSGTTLLDTILRSHTRVSVIEEKPILNRALRNVVSGVSGDETNFTEEWLDQIDACDPAQLRASYLEQMAEYAGEALDDGRIYVDKLPLNMNRAPTIQRMFPRAVFILAGRNPLDVAISNLVQDFSPNNAMLNMTSMARIDRLYDLSFSLWEAFEVWRKPIVERVTYENLVEDLEASVTPLMRRLGLEFEPAQARYFETARGRGRINTPSATQVTQSLYKTSTERWRNYAFAFEGEDSARLRAWADKLGYRLD